MDIIISNTSGVPIYEQIERQIRELILRGELKEGDALPSMRSLAKDLRISMITTKRAYEDLERDGFIESYTGRGSFVKAQSKDFLRETEISKVEELITEAVNKGLGIGLSGEEMSEIFQMILKERENGE